jgi:hypothetical protein
LRTTREEEDERLPRFPQYESLVELQRSFGWLGSTHLWKVVRFWETHQSSNLQRQKIHPTSTSHSTDWTSRINYSHLDPLPQSLVRPKSSISRPQSTNQKSFTTASRPVPHSVSRCDLRNQRSQFVYNCWFYPSLEGHFSYAPDPPHLENVLAVNEARILRHVASRRNNLHTGQ